MMDGVDGGEISLTDAQALFMVGSTRTLEQAKMGAIAAETLPQGGAKVLREYIKHLQDEDLILRAD